TSIYSVTVSAIGAVAGIMIAQYLGQKNKQEVRRSFYLNLVFAVGLAVLFTAFCMMFPTHIMGIYTKDGKTMLAAGSYLRIVAGTFLPMAGATLLSTLVRCMEKASLPLYASIVAACLNTGLNYILIFGKFGFAPMGADGAAIATVISQAANFLLMFILLWKEKDCFASIQNKEKVQTRFDWKQYIGMLAPILVCEVLWSLGENVYAVIYGHLGTAACAAMTLTNPVQGLMIGALCGLSQAAGVIIGKKLGNKEYDEAYEASKKLILYGFVGSFILSAVIIIIMPFYVEIYQVENTVKTLTKQILVAYALVAPFKVQNMIVGGGIIRSGGKTKYVMVIDIIGTWVFGVPLGLVTAFVLNLSIPYVYFILSLEECVRFAISVVVFRKRKWMQSLDSE
ncbi:MAG: MATE family efflux transporter, partial [Dorea sp.]